VTNWNESGEKQRSIGEPNAADEILIVDYVMLDFVDEPLIPRRLGNRRQRLSDGVTTRRGVCEDPLYSGA
jgi:hypothetical protein